jgi:hypothetical protein
MHRFWFNRTSVIAAWIGLLLAAVSPPTGLGVPLCFFHSSTGIDCPGCGLTRSLSCAMRGMVAESWHYHPMGILILALFVVIAVQSILPRDYRQKIRGVVEHHSLAFKRFNVLFVATFVAFGAVRAMLEFKL